MFLFNIIRGLCCYRYYFCCYCFRKSCYRRKKKCGKEPNTKAMSFCCRCCMTARKSCFRCYTKATSSVRCPGCK